MIAAGYTLDLYCDVVLDDWQHRVNTEYTRGYGVAQFFGDEGAVACAEARQAGWKFNMRTGVAVCPTCVNAGRAPSSAYAGEDEKGGARS